MKNKLYLDYNATTPCDPKVIEEMSPYLNENFGNPSSIHHSFGWIAKDAVDASVQSIAKTLDIKPDNIVFTSGSTEGINMVLKSFCTKHKPGGNHIITCKTEHKAVIDTCKYMEKYEGVSITYLDVNDAGVVDLDQLKASIRPETILICLMYANNETGVLQPIKEVADIIKNQNILFFTDATQALGKIDLTSVFKHVDYACFSSHKTYGPKGMGMIVCKNIENEKYLKTMIHGGGQQNDWRGGTINSPGIIGFSKSIELCYKNLPDENLRLTKLRNMLEDGLLKIELSFNNSHAAIRLPNTTNISFAYVNGAGLLRALSTHMAVSNGSACNALSDKPSHVLTAMGIGPELAFSSLRFSLGRFTTETDVKRAIKIVGQEVDKLRESNILWERRNK